MKITLAYPFTHDGKDYQPDETIEVDDQLGRSMIFDGTARPADKAGKTRSTPSTPTSGDTTSKEGDA